MRSGRGSRCPIIKSEPACSLLSAHAVLQFYESLFMSGAYVFHSTFLKMIADAAKDDNPLADLDPALLTKESREKAIIKVENGISSGLITLPEPLTAFFKSLGSTDMHFENIICDGCFPAVIDLETTGLMMTMNTVHC